MVPLILLLLKVCNLWMYAPTYCSRIDCVWNPLIPVALILFHVASQYFANILWLLSSPPSDSGWEAESTEFFWLSAIYEFDPLSVRICLCVPNFNKMFSKNSLATVSRSCSCMVLLPYINWDHLEMYIRFLLKVQQWQMHILQLVDLQLS